VAIPVERIAIISAILIALGGTALYAVRRGNVSGHRVHDTG
jgi:hypothetical protein